jgi:hypothetical protein
MIDQGESEAAQAANQGDRAVRPMATGSFLE